MCEGANFALLSAKGYPVYTIYHVDVVDYFTTIYLRSLVRPEWTTSLYRKIHQWGLSGLLPDVLNLVWNKQEASVRHSKGLIVPSRRMTEMLLRSYPGTESGRIHVLPWGTWEDEVPSEDIHAEIESIAGSFPIVPGAWVLLTQSRISPEKGQDRLLEALALWEKRPDYPKAGICLFIAGEAAYMLGRKFE